ncbi:MAG TPA: tetratricopeptide repeat protein [Candidatus Aquilonibacter sp.]|nr:tetratricopeptide repeat protein [Candidatus Aquilonibacter sp.]
MAFGFGFNKQKVLSSAEKYVQQGKLQNAISEYEKILKNDAKDLTVANTVGDLYARLGENDKATECFKNVGDAYASQGFTVKAIAMYKKISKLKPSLESVLKLAELYTQQGLFNDARAQYLQVAEEFLKAGELDNAVRIFQKILEMDPENVNMRVRLAEVYIRLGKKEDAWQIFSAAAESLRSKGSLSSAEEILQRMLSLDPGNGYALLMQGRNLLESGDAEAAVAALLKVPDLDTNPDGLRDLLKAYLKTGRLSDAGTLANKLLAVHNDLAAISTFADALMQAGQYENALQVYDQHAERLLAENSEKVLQNLRTIIGHVRENPDSLEKLLSLFHKAGDTTHTSEVTELLAHSCVQSGQLPRARDLYQKLTALEPSNTLHMQNYQQVVAKLGGVSGTKLISAEEAAVIVDELEATAPSIHQHYSDQVSLAVRSALTDAELFISYNMPAKALGPLLAALPQAPNDLRLNQRLAALHTRASRFAEAAVCCRTLQNVYSEAGYPDEATRYGELAERYEERAATPAHRTSDAEADLAVGHPEVGSEQAAEFGITSSPWPSEAPEMAVEASSPVEEPEFAVVDEEPSAEPEAAAGEIDLSSEWDDAITIDTDADAPSGEPVEIEAAETGVADEGGGDKVDETIEEIRFYLEHGMPDQAAAALAKLQTMTRDETKIAPIRAEVEAGTRPTAAQEEQEPEPVAEFTVEEPGAEVAEEPTEEEAVQAPVDEPEPAAALQPHPAHEAIHALLESQAAVPEAEPSVLKSFVSDLEASLGDGFLPGTVAREEKAPASKPARVRPHEEKEREAVARADAEAAATQQGHVLGEFVADLESSLGEDFLKQAPVPEPASMPAAASAPTPAPLATPRIKAPAAASAAAAAAVGAPAVHSQPHAPALRPATPPPAEAPKRQISPVLPSAAPAPAAKASPFGEEAGVDLAEMFGELKHDLESDVATADEDPETHYNLGIAFREMGLLDEAIGELQKTCQAVDRGHSFPQVMQTYTWLAQCFLEKGVPEASIRWYQKALSVPSIDEDTRTALHYELAGAYETAGDRSAALKHFTEVYGRNIDHRDVAERIKALKS